MIKDIRRKFISITGIVGLLMFLSSGVLLADTFSFDFVFENDGDLTNSPFGTLMVNNDTIDSLEFDIMADTSKLGINADIHSFGFMIDFASTLNFNGSDIIGTPSSGGIQGAGSRTDFDYVVSFGNGNPTVNPTSFTIQASGLTIDALWNAGTTTQNNKPYAQFMMHVQSTSPANPGSETVGGSYAPAPVPEPATMLLFGTGLVGLVGARFRKKK